MSKQSSGKVPLYEKILKRKDSTKVTGSTSTITNASTSASTSKESIGETQENIYATISEGTRSEASTEVMNIDSTASFHYETNNEPQSEQQSVASTYYKTYCRTCYTTDVYDYTWQLEHFPMVYKSMPVIQSSAISKPLWCKIEMRLCQAVADKSEDTIIKFHILLYTEEAYHGVWDISAIYLDEKRLCASTGGYVTNNSCLYETTAQTLLQYLEEDRLTLNFTITVARDMLNETLHSIPLRTNRINETEDYRNLIINKANLYSSQIIFKKDYGTDNYIFKISKGLLQSTRSTYFTKLCNMHRRDEDQDSTVILDDESDIFVIMLTFIKTGSLPESVSSNYDTLTKLLRAAHKYDIVELKSLCEQYLIANITVKNVINLLDVAIEFKADKLRKHIIYYIKFYFKELIKLEEFQKLPQICLNEITKVLQECKVENESEIDVSTKFT